jgi:hypothetical protein
MSADPILVDAQPDGEAVPSAMPRFLKRLVVTVVALAVIGALILFAGRGNAFVVDLYGLTGLSFCS